MRNSSGGDGGPAWREMAAAQQSAWVRGTVRRGAAGVGGLQSVHRWSSHMSATAHEALPRRKKAVLGSIVAGGSGVSRRLPDGGLRRGGRAVAGLDARRRARVAAMRRRTASSGIVHGGARP